MGTFGVKIGPKSCHIAAKMALLGFLAAELRADVLHCQVVLIFAHLRASGDALENNRFSVLKKSRRAALGCPAPACRRPPGTAALRGMDAG